MDDWCWCENFRDAWEVDAECMTVVAPRDRLFFDRRKMVLFSFLEPTEMAGVW